MKLLIYILLAVGIIITGQCDYNTTPASPAQQKARALSAAESSLEGQAMSAVQRASRDPGSVKFGVVRAGPGLLAACGTFNGKNSFGAYTGMQEFISNGDMVITRQAMSSQAEWAKAWNKLCVKLVVAGNWHHVTASKLLIRDDNGSDFIKLRRSCA